ncbi:MAG: sialidase family protein [Christensenellales bacterium]|jgi:hypothetical protein
MKLPSRKELIERGYPFGKVTEGIPFGDPANEWARTQPDAKIYIPEKDMGNDCDNCVLAVIPTFDESELLAVWTQSTKEAFGDNRIVIARSGDGVNWSGTKVIAGAMTKEDRQSSWGFPMYTKSGRLYIFFIQETDRGDLPRAASGELALMYSEDDGHTWSKPGIAPLPRGRYDHPDPSINKNWWCFQTPIRDAEGKYIVGITIETSPAVKPDRLPYPHNDSRAAFLRFENLDDNPEPEDVRVTISPTDGLEVPDKSRPHTIVAQEPAPVLLPDGRLFATMRTMTGNIYYTVYEKSAWREAAPLNGFDGQPVPHPLGPCPIYRLEDGRYLCLTYNNPGKRLGYDLFAEPAERWAGNICRNPLFFMVGVYKADDEQPIRFGKPHLFMDSDDVAVGARKKSSTAPLYTAITQWHGKNMIWYPDRKYYILGKEIPAELLDELTPEG